MRLKKLMYGMINSKEVFSDELTNWLIYKAGFKQTQCYMSMYYKNALHVSKLVVLYYVDDFIYWYTYEELGKFLCVHLERDYIRTS